MLEKITKGFGSMPIALSLALSAVIVILAACGGGSSSGSKDDDPSSSSHVPSAPVEVDTTVIKNFDFFVGEVSGNQRQYLDIRVDVAGNQANAELDEKGLKAVVKLNGTDISSDLNCSGKVSYSCNGTYTFSNNQYCGEEFQVCAEVYALNTSEVRVRECETRSRDANFCASSSSAEPSSSSADTRTFVLKGNGEIKLTSSTPCISLSTGQALSIGNGDICLTAANGFSANGNTSISVVFAPKEGSTVIEGIFPTDPGYGDPSTLGPADFPLRNHPDAWSAIEGYNTNNYYAVCTSGGPKSEWDNTCYIMLPIDPFITGSALSGSVKIWGLQ